MAARIYDPDTSFKTLAAQAFSFAPRVPLTVRAQTKEGLLVRFSHHGIYQSTFQDLAGYALECPTRDGFEIEEETDASAGGARSAVERLLARVKPVRRPPARPGTFRYRPVRDCFRLDLAALPAWAARVVEQAVSRLGQEGANATGYFSAFRRRFFVASAAGARASHVMTSVRLGVTARRGGGRGYATFLGADPQSLPVERVCEDALWLARENAKRDVSLEAGEYDCLFSPRAFQEFVSSLWKNFDAKRYHTGESALARRLKQRVASQALSLADDVHHRGQSGLPFDAEGVPKRAL